MTEFKPGDIVISNDGKTIVEVWHDETPEEPETFTGQAFNMSEPYATSCFWLKSHFINYEPTNNQNTIKEYKPKYDKGYRVTSAVYRMLKQRKIKEDCAISLLHERAGTPKEIAKGCVELWLANPLKHLNTMEQS